jgi:hypothetical protein
MLTFQFINKSLKAIFKQKFLVKKFYIEQDPDPVFSEVGSGSASKLSGSATLLKSTLI